VNATPPRAAGPATVDVPLRYLVAAVIAFALAAPGVVWLAPELTGHYYHPRIVALAHTVTLGWITLAIMGASYQLIPIVLGRPVWSLRAARWQFWLVVIAVTGMIAHFYIATWLGLVMAAVMFACGVVLHLVNVVLSFRGVDRSRFTACLIAFAYTGLALTVAFGLLLGIDHLHKFLPGGFFSNLHAHVHLALLGWVMPIVLGVSARVYPMFLLAPVPQRWSERMQFWGLTIGVPALVLGLLLELPAGVIVGALAVSTAALAHLGWIASMTTRRRRPRLDWGLRLVLAGAAFIVPGLLLGWAFALGLIAGPRFALAYAVVILGGWISLTIAGMMLKIVPFLVWYRLYGSRAGKERVPTLPDLSCVHAEGAACVLLVVGFIALPAAMAGGNAEAIRIAGIILTLGGLSLAAALGRVLMHLAHRNATTRASRLAEVKR
jgi:hypothetical protein